MPEQAGRMYSTVHPTTIKASFKVNLIGSPNQADMQELMDMERLWHAKMGIVKHMCTLDGRKKEREYYGEPMASYESSSYNKLRKTCMLSR